MNKNSPNRRAKNAVRGNTKNTRKDWLVEAQRVLIEEGVDRVKVDRLAKNLNVTRGGFYWFFKNRQDLLNSLLDDWKDSKNDPLEHALKKEADDPLKAFTLYSFSLVRERSFSPSLDSAVRDWARMSKHAREAVDFVDNRRMKALTEIFLGLDYDKEEAHVRARVFYYHQIGYYAVNVHESPEQRLHFLPIYFKQLTGFDFPEQAFREFVEELSK